MGSCSLIAKKPARTERAAAWLRMVQLIYKCGDLVPGFANDNRLAVLDLARREVQTRGGFINDHRETGNTRRSLDPSGSTLDRLRGNARAIQFLADVVDDFKPAQLE
jgi:hypothetical protein